MDPMLAGATFPCRVNEEGIIMMPLREEYDELWLRNMKDANTTNVFDEEILLPVLDLSWHCDNKALMDVEGYPLTQYYYTPDGVWVQVGPAPAFFPINQETPTDSVPSHMVLQH
jgi:hypothetical protein